MRHRIACLSMLVVLAVASRPGRAGDETAGPEPKRVEKTNEEWAAELTNAQFVVTRLKETEPAFSGRYVHTKAKGTYHCICCGAPLFSATAKFDSGTGWPSFWRPIALARIATAADLSGGEQRVEVMCSRCD